MRLLLEPARTQKPRELVRWPTRTSCKCVSFHGFHGGHGTHLVKDKTSCFGRILGSIGIGGPSAQVLPRPVLEVVLLELLQLLVCPFPLGFSLNKGLQCAEGKASAVPLA
jgi:hypothetical protein